MVNEVVDVVDRALPKRLKSLAKRLLPGIDRRIYRLVQRASSDERSTVQIKGGILEGRSFRCVLKYERNYWLGLHEIALMEFIVKRLQPGDVVYDIGAHKGYFTLAAAACVGPEGRVLAFEPNPENFSDTSHNVSLNPDIAPRVQILPLAVTDKAGSEQFIGGTNASVGHVVREAASSALSGDDVYRVTATSLDEFVAQGAPPPALVKMDIEGAEKWALLGVREVLRRHRAALLVEVHDRESAEQLCQVAHEVDYRLSTLQGETLAEERLFEKRDYVVALPTP